MKSTNDKIDEVLRDVGEDYYPYSEFGKGYEKQNEKTILEAKLQILSDLESMRKYVRYEDSEGKGYHETNAVLLSDIREYIGI